MTEGPLIHNPGRSDTLACVDPESVIGDLLVCDQFTASNARRLPGFDVGLINVVRLSSSYPFGLSRAMMRSPRSLLMKYRFP